MRITRVQISPTLEPDLLTIDGKSELVHFFSMLTDGSHMTTRLVRCCCSRCCTAADERDRRIGEPYHELGYVDVRWATSSKQQNVWRQGERAFLYGGPFTYCSDPKIKHLRNVSFADWEKNLWSKRLPGLEMLHCEHGNKRQDLMSGYHGFTTIVRNSSLLSPQKTFATMGTQSMVESQCQGLRRRVLQWWTSWVSFWNRDRWFWSLLQEALWLESPA